MELAGHMDWKGMAIDNEGFKVTTVKESTISFMGPVLGGARLIAQAIIRMNYGSVSAVTHFYLKFHINLSATVFALQSIGQAMCYCWVEDLSLMY